VHPHRTADRQHRMPGSDRKREMRSGVGAGDSVAETDRTPPAPVLHPRIRRRQRNLNTGREALDRGAPEVGARSPRHQPRISARHCWS
jgi:hypothetical protein